MKENLTYYSIRVQGNDKPYLGQNLDKFSMPGWITFERVSTKTGQITKMEINMNQVISISESDYKMDE
jgi:hypothetical protein